jgi:hypothetical protein
MHAMGVGHEGLGMLKEWLATSPANNLKRNTALKLE